MNNFGMPMGMGMPNMPMNMMNMGGMGTPMNMNMMQMGGMGNPMNMNMMQMGAMPNMNMMQMEEDNEWLKGFQMGVDEVNNNSANNDPDLSGAESKINILFTTTIGTKRNVVLNQSATVDRALRKYLEVIGKSNLVNSDKISFLYNAAKLKFGDDTLLQNFFKNISNPKVVVNDTNNLIGASLLKFKIN